MKYLIGLITSLVLTACSTAPVIIPDITKDNVVMKKLDWEITHDTHLTTNWGWILWYLPIVFLVVVWAYNQYLKTKCTEEETDSTTEASKPTEQPPSQS
jgi:nucleoside recognition membrane protein YjiH